MRAFFARILAGKGGRALRQRSEEAEWLDGPVDDPAQLAHSFREVWGVNRYLGGLAVLRRHLAPWLGVGVPGTAGHDTGPGTGTGPGTRPMTLVDVAGGTGDVAVALTRWAAGRGVSLAVTVVDIHPQVVAIARERAAFSPLARVLQGDARRLPFEDGAFDLAICNLALHHFDPPEARAVLREMDRVSRLGWIAADLERHPLAHASARVMARTVWRNPITRHDGPASVRRSYRADEAADLVQTAGLAAVIHRHFPFRWAAVCRRAP
jgi:ubiquinone/menaquinone biosynthesis C-methylase UbiE